MINYQLLQLCLVEGSWEEVDYTSILQTDKQAYLFGDKLLSTTTTLSCWRSVRGGWLDLYFAKIFLVIINFVSLQVGEGRVAKVADFGLTRDVYIDEAYWKRSSGKCKFHSSSCPISPSALSANQVDGPRVNEGLPLHIKVRRLGFRGESFHSWMAVTLKVGLRLNKQSTLLTEVLSSNEFLTS